MRWRAQINYLKKLAYDRAAREHGRSKKRHLNYESVTQAEEAAAAHAQAEIFADALCAAEALPLVARSGRERVK
jgi:hypothetical protein